MMYKSWLCRLFCERLIFRDGRLLISYTLASCRKGLASAYTNQIGFESDLISKKKGTFAAGPMYYSHQLKIKALNN